MGPRLKQSILFITAVLGIAALRLAPQIIHGAWHLSNNAILSQTDSGSYIAIAQRMTGGKSFIDLSDMGGLGRTPGYPLFLALCMRLLGPNLIWPVFIQNLLLATAIYPLYKLILTLSGSATLSYIGTGLWVFDASTFVYSSYIYTEALYVCLTIWWLFFFIQYLNSNSWSKWKAFAIGMAWGIITLVRPIGLYAPLIFATILLLNKRWPITKRWVAIFLLLCGFELVIFPVLLRNYQQSHQFRLSNQLDLITRELANSSVAMRKGVSYQDACLLVPQEVSGHGNTYEECCAWELRSHPVTYLRLYAKGIGMLLFTPGSRDFCNLTGLPTDYAVRTGRYENPGGSTFLEFFSMLRHSNWLKDLFVLFSLFILVLIYGFGLVGIRTIGNESSAQQLLHLSVLFLFIYYVVITGAVGTTRYRTPLMPLSILLATAGARQLRFLATFL